MPSCNREDLGRFLHRLPRYDSLFYKSLSHNDHVWADNGNNQSGFLVPRDSLAFFGLEELPAEKTRIALDVEWFLDGEIHTRKDCTTDGRFDTERINYYIDGNRSSRPETHLTCVYEPYFEHLDDGALLVMGRMRDSVHKYDAIIVGPEEEALLRRLFEATEIPEGGSWGIVEGEARIFDVTLDLLALLEQRARDLYEAAGNERPSTEETTDAVWDIIGTHSELLRGAIKCNGLSNSKQPFETAVKNAPGNLVRWFLNKLEFRVLKFVEKQYYPPQICEVLRSQAQSYPPGWNELTGLMGRALDGIIEVSKSLTQSRAARAGQSFENHVKRLLEYHGACFETQVGIEKVDFLVHSAKGDLRLGAKTSTRERWKQLPKGAYFVTLDRTVTENTLSKMAKRDLKLVVPEEDNDKYGIRHYNNCDIVLSFRDFMGDL